MTNSYEVKYNLIVESCQIEPDYKKIQNYVKEINDWDSVLNISYVHGVLPLVYRTLKREETVPTIALNTFKQQNMQIAQRNMQMTAELIRITKLFANNNINILSFKGPSLSQMIHGNIFDRQYTDIDILIAENDLYRAGKLLIANNYKSEYLIKFLKNNTLLKIEKDFVLSHKQNGTSLELHWKLFENRLVYKTNLNYFIKPFQQIIINKQKINILHDEQLLLYLSLHGSKHYWERIEWIVDIDRLIRKYNMNWEILISLAKKLEIENIFYFSLWVSNTMFSTPIPKEIINKIKIHNEIKKNTDKVLALIYSNHIGNTQLYSSIRFKKWEKLQDNIKNNYILKSKSRFQLRAADIYTINLPNILSLLYYIIAYYRTLKRYILKLFTKATK